MSAESKKSIKYALLQKGKSVDSIGKESEKNNSVNLTQNYPQLTEDFRTNLITPTDYTLKNDISLIQALKEISIIALPTILFFLCLFAQQSINLIFIGHFYEGKDKQNAIDGIGISHLYINCTLLSIVVGIISGFETLGSNAFGAKKYYLMGLYLHRSLLIGYILAFVILIVHFFTAVQVLSLFPIDENVLIYVSKYIKISMFFILFDVLFSVNFRYLNIIEKSYINLIILGVTLILHPLWCYILINYLKLGVQGAAISLILSQGLNSIMGCLYILTFRHYPQTIFFFNRDSFKGWWQYLKIALPSAFLTCAEWWAFEILSIVAIWISELDYTVHILITNISSLFLTIPIGFGMAATILVGKNISIGNLNLVKKYTKIIIVTGATIQVILSSITTIFRDEVMNLYIDDIKVKEKGSTILLLLPLINLFDFIQCMLNSVCRGLGIQLIASIIAFANFYLLQLSLSIVLGISLKLGVFGIWTAMLIGCATCGIIYSITLYKSDLEKIKEEIVKRLDYDNKLNENEDEVLKQCDTFFILPSQTDEEKKNTDVDTDPERA
jgi:multidrug resistance protein, MATE family